MNLVHADKINYVKIDRFHPDCTDAVMVCAQVGTSTVGVPTRWSLFHKAKVLASGTRICGTRMFSLIFIALIFITSAESALISIAGSANNTVRIDLAFCSEQSLTAKFSTVSYQWTRL